VIDLLALLTVAADCSLLWTDRPRWDRSRLQHYTDGFVDALVRRECLPVHVFSYCLVSTNNDTATRSVGLRRRRSRACTFYVAGRSLFIFS